MMNGEAMGPAERAWERELLARLGEGERRPGEPADETGRMPTVGLHPMVTDRIIADRIGADVLTRGDRIWSGADVLTRGDRIWIRRLRLDPKWEIKALPTQPVTPVQTISPPIAVGAYQLWAMPDKLGEGGATAGGLAFFALARPRLEAFGLTVRMEQQSGTLRLTGGDASLALSAYPENSLEEVEALRQSWGAALAAAGLGDRAWIYQPLVMQGLMVSLDVPEDYLAGTPVISVAADMGDASVRIPLSAFGAQSFKTALDTRRGDTLPGICTMSAQFLAQHGTTLTTRQQNLVAPLSAMLAGAGPEHVRVVNPQVTFEANVIVRGHTLLESAVVNWMPSEGHSPEALIFGPSGGEYKALIASDDLRRVMIDWNAVVRYKPAEWPVVQSKGKLSVALSDWNLSINPETWVASYSVVVLPIDAQGNVMRPSAALDPADTLTCEIRYSAPFLAGGAPLRTAFTTRNEAMQVAFPMPPGEALGEVRLTMFAVRGGKDEMKVRVLKPNESLVVVRVFANARIDIKTNQDPVEESSEVGWALTALADFAAGRQP